MSNENKILIVDDEPVIRIMMEQLLLGDGYVLKSVSSGDEALEVLPSFDPDIILLDIQMPGLDGYDVCTKIRADEQYHFTKIIMVSGCAQVEERLKGYSVGADDYLAKPFDDQELLAKVKVYTRLKRREEIDQVKGDLLTLLTHETRTPINGILGCADILLNDKSLNDEQLEFVRMISMASTQLHGFLENCLLLSKLKAGVELVKSNESVNVILSAVCDLIEKQYEDKCHFEVDIEPRLILFADWQLLKSAFQFVLDNSAKYSPDGEVVKVVATCDEKWCQIIIDDKGVGVDAQRRQNIFDEFSIQDVTHHQKGQGISLAITSRICNCHGGKIEALDNPIGKGARFILTIPVLS